MGKHLRTEREPTNSEKQNPGNVTVTLENMAPEQTKDTVKQVRQGNLITTTKQNIGTIWRNGKSYHRKNGRLDVETKELQYEILKKYTPEEFTNIVDKKRDSLKVRPDKTGKNL